VTVGPEQEAVVSRKIAGENDARAQSVRRAKIREDALARGYVAIDELADALAVSAMTIHRDLDSLVEEGWLLKVRGGARIHPAALLDTTVRSRAERNVSEKAAIARQALSHVRQGHVVFLDESTSAAAMIDGLPERGPLTVVTNSLRAIVRLSGEPGIELISTGGSYRHGYDAFFGMIATDAIGRLQADIVFLSTTAIDQGQCCHKSEETVQFKRALVQSSAFKVLLADHSKFGLRALHRLAPVTAFDLVIVDAEIATEDLEALRASGVAVEIAPVEQPAMLARRQG
jgi:DeoR/GlpR family transcriptional regulator of sugar metabolism